MDRPTFVDNYPPGIAHEGGAARPAPSALMRSARAAPGPPGLTAPGGPGRTERGCGGRSWCSSASGGHTRRGVQDVDGRFEDVDEAAGPYGGGPLQSRPEAWSVPAAAGQVFGELVIFRCWHPRSGPVPLQQSGGVAAQGFGEHGRHALTNDAVPCAARPELFTGGSAGHVVRTVARSTWTPGAGSTDVWVEGRRDGSWGRCPAWSRPASRQQQADRSSRPAPRTHPGPYPAPRPVPQPHAMRYTR
ncbi:MAG: hypothetical protein QOI36_6354 [Pseudonocardiales bacterium]|jgi:hypothetical protein|nr:hypothetical protein [Pseudonocardiales bacterium]